MDFLSLLPALTVAPESQAKVLENGQGLGSHWGRLEVGGPSGVMLPAPVPLRVDISSSRGREGMPEWWDNHACALKAYKALAFKSAQNSLS